MKAYTQEEFERGHKEVAEMANISAEEVEQ